MADGQFLSMTIIHHFAKWNNHFFFFPFVIFFVWQVRNLLCLLTRDLPDATQNLRDLIQIV